MDITKVAISSNNKNPHQQITIGDDQLISATIRNRLIQEFDGQSTDINALWLVTSYNITTLPAFNH